MKKMINAALQMAECVLAHDKEWEVTLTPKFALVKEGDKWVKASKSWKGIVVSASNDAKVTCPDKAIEDIFPQSHFANEVAATAQENNHLRIYVPFGTINPW